MFATIRSLFGNRSHGSRRRPSTLVLEVLEGLALPSAVLPAPDLGETHEIAAEVRQQDYSAIAFVGGWGASSYQYAYHDSSTGVNIFVLGDGSIRSNGYGTQAPDASDYSAIAFVGGRGSSSGGVQVVLADGSVRFLKETVGRVADDVIVDGRIITGENWDSARAGDDRPTEEVAFYYNKIHVHDATAAPSGIVAEDAAPAAHGDFFLDIRGVDGDTSDTKSVTNETLIGIDFRPSGS